MTGERDDAQDDPPPASAESPSEGSESDRLEKLVQLLESAGSQDRSELAHRIQAAVYRGPMPPPAMLAEYERAIPGTGERIVGGWEEQQRHRQDMEREVLHRIEARLDKGQIHALAVALVGLALAAVLALLDADPWIAGVMAAVSVGGPPAASLVARQLAAKRSRG